MDNQILEQLQKARRIALFNVLKDANPIQKVWFERWLCYDIVINKIIFNDFDYDYDKFIKEHPCMLPEALKEAEDKMKDNY